MLFTSIEHNSKLKKYPYCRPTSKSQSWKLGKCKYKFSKTMSEPSRGIGLKQNSNEMKVNGIWALKNDQ
jgi:hypothetical protein